MSVCRKSILPKCQQRLVCYASTIHFRKWPTIFRSMGHFGPPILKKNLKPLEIFMTVPEHPTQWSMKFHLLIKTKMLKIKNVHPFIQTIQVITRDDFFYPILARIMDSFFCSPLNTSFYIGLHEKEFQKIPNTLRCDKVTLF